jgi:hypothetical protein
MKTRDVRSSGRVHTSCDRLHAQPFTPSPRRHRCRAEARGRYAVLGLAAGGVKHDCGSGLADEGSVEDTASSA